MSQIEQQEIKIGVGGTGGEFGSVDRDPELGAELRQGCAALRRDWVGDYRLDVPGADDYILKPIKAPLVLARVNAAFRRLRLA